MKKIALTGIRTRVDRLGSGHTNHCTISAHLHVYTQNYFIFVQKSILNSIKSQLCHSSNLLRLTLILKSLISAFLLPSGLLGLGGQVFFLSISQFAADFPSNFQSIYNSVQGEPPFFSCFACSIMLLTFIRQTSSKLPLYLCEGLKFIGLLAARSKALSSKSLFEFYLARSSS